MADAVTDAVTDAVPIDDGAETPPPVSAGGVRQRIGQVVKLVATVVILAAVVYFLARSWDDVTAAWKRLSWPTLALSTFAALCGMSASSMAWRAAVRDDFDHAKRAQNSSSSSSSS